MIMRDDSNRISSLISVILFSCLISVLLVACNERPPDSPESIVESSIIEINDYQVPIFSTPKEQFNYTRSWFARMQEKEASLQAFIKIYPQEKRFCGLASLDLAYLQLGSDYRYSDESSSFAAIKDYKAIIKSFSEYPDIAAKARWYIGCIYSDLLKDKRKGIEEYQKIISLYPRENVTLLSPPPWVSIIYRTDANVNITLSNRPKKNWAALALVEIIRSAEFEDTAWAAFIKLWQNYRDDVATGFGLRVMLQKRYHTEKTLKMAHEYMEEFFSNVHILGDIQKEINDISHVKGGVVQ